MIYNEEKSKLAQLIEDERVFQQVQAVVAEAERSENLNANQVLLQPDQIMRPEELQLAEWELPDRGEISPGAENAMAVRIRKENQREKAAEIRKK